MPADGEPDRLVLGPFHPETLGLAYRELTIAFRSAGLDTPGLDARRLIAVACDVPDHAALSMPERRLATGDAQRLEGFLQRRLTREPVSRIVGRRSFHGLDLDITPATLDPRPETETLVDGVLNLIARGAVPGGAAPRILDLGTGSGAILLALLRAVPNAVGLGVDISPAALEVANRNAARLGLGARATFQRSHWLSEIDGPFDVIVANPPYIPTRLLEHLEADVARYDPAAALDGGTDGLDAYRCLIAAAFDTLVEGGWLALEVGAGQAGDVAALCRTAAAALSDDDIRVWTDLSGIARCVVVQWCSRPVVR